MGRAAHGGATMRLFTAIDLPPELLLRLERLLSALRPEALIKWSPLDNLHVTTKFIGEWPERRLEELDGALAGLTPREPFELAVRDLGWFPNERSPRVLWAGVHAGPELLKLVQETEERLEKLGVAKEERPFSPHLTLARIKNPVPLRALHERVRATQPADLGKFEVKHFCLFRSDPGSNASIYRRLRDYRFEAALAAS
jgi:RNA 2',3'-cyclic 3'-phosphodiesterase